MWSSKESLAKKNVFAQKYDEIRRLDGRVVFMAQYVMVLRGATSLRGAF